MALRDLIQRGLEEIDHGLWQISTFFGRTPESYCDLETVDDDNTLVARDGSLISMLEISGGLEMIGPEEFNRMISILQSKMTGSLKGVGHIFDFVIVRDVERARVKEDIDYIMAPSRMTARRLQLTVDDLLDSGREKLLNYCAVERVFLAVFTVPSALTSVERSSGLRERAAATHSAPRSRYGQNLQSALPRLREPHRALTRSLENNFRDARIIARQLTTRDALIAMRSEVDPEWTDKSWSPKLPGDSVTPNVPEEGESPKDFSSILWPSLPRQIWPRGLVARDFRTVEVGNRLYLPMTMAAAPASLESFSSLFSALKDTDVPWRVSFRLTGGGTEQTAFKLRRAMSLLSNTKPIRRALADAASDAENGHVRVGLQVVAVTWVDNNDSDQLNRNAARIARAFQSWGGAEMDDRLGSPLAAMAATIPGNTLQSPAPLSVPPLDHAIGMLPVSRQASPWDRGSCLFRTPDGKLYPYAAFSDRQAAWVTLIYAPQGGGKSVLLNKLNLSLALSPGLEKLPRIGILDIGPSSAGMISLIQAELPPREQRKVFYKKMRMTKEYCVNPCDTQLGCRRPLSFHRTFLINFLSLLATPDNSDRPYEGVTGLATYVIDAAYQKYSDDGDRARRYSPAICPEVDNGIQRLGLNIDDHTIWWELVDQFFDAGEISLAEVAQRYAVPTIGEMAGLAKERDATEVYKSRTPSQEPLCDYFWRALTDAIRQYPILAEATRLDLSIGRIVSLDLSEVAPKGGSGAAKQTSVMYLLGRFLLGKDFLLHEDHLDEIPTQYRRYYRNVVEETENEFKRLCFDEFQRTRGISAIRDQVQSDIAEGRKANLEVVLASQRLADFDEQMVDLAGTQFILGVGQVSLQETVDTFRLNSAAHRELDNLGAPTSAGSKFLAHFRMKDGTYSQILMATLSSEELWAFSTTREDRSIRDLLYSRISPREARHLLAQKFPGGTAKPEVERRKESIRKDGAMGDDTTVQVLKSIVREIIALAEKKRRNAGAKVENFKKAG